MTTPARPCGDDCDDRSVMPTGHCCMDGPETRPARQLRHLRCIAAARAVAAPLVLAVDPAAPPPTDALILVIARALQSHTDPMEQ